MRSSQPPIGRCGNYHLTEKQMNHIGTWESDTVKEPGFQSRHLTAALHSRMRYSYPVVSTSDAASEIITCKSSQCCLSLSEVQMRHQFASDVAMGCEESRGITEHDQKCPLSSARLQKLGQWPEQERYLGESTSWPDVGDAQIVVTAGVRWVQSQQGELVVSKSKESFWIISTLPHIFKR